MQATAEKKKILQSIDALGRRVTAADVATKTGLSLVVVSSELNAIAEETGGHLEVSTTGDIAYKFSPGFQTAYLAKGIKRVLQTTGSWLCQAGLFLLRISFGIMLILSLLIIGIIVMAIILRGGSGNSGRGGRMHVSLGFWDFRILSELFYWGAYSARSRSRSRSHRLDRRTEPGNNFLLNCFSFLFGDGNPNEGVDERKWQLVAQVIRKNGGVVTSEQLAPYTGAAPSNEDGALPVLVRFNGRPEVSESGNIVYTFPSLQVSAADHSGTSVPAFLREYPWKFSEAPAEALIPVYVLAGVNFFGSLWLYSNINRIVLVHELSALVYFLLFYGTFFVLVPTVRYLALQLIVNPRIEARNNRRHSYARLLENPEPALAAKLSEARQYELKAEKIGRDNVLYTTEQDALEQEFEA